MAQTNWTPRQLGCALTEIVRGAQVLRRLALIQECEWKDQDERDSQALAVAAQIVATHIGWLADAAASHAAPGEGYHDVRPPLEWAMPPAFFDQKGI